MPKVVFLKGAKRFEVYADPGQSLLEAAMASRVPIYHTCGGNASCSTCRVNILSGAGNLTPIEADESRVLDAFDLKGATRLACQCILSGGSVEAEIPERGREPRANKTPPLPE